MPTVIAVLNPKGGSGKSTLATNLARAVQLGDDRAEAPRGARSVLVVDLDPQGTAVDWKNQEPDGAGLPSVIQILDAGRSPTWTRSPRRTTSS